MKTLATTLCIVHQPPRVLLGMKKRGFGAGRWNGFGGKVEIETIEDNVRRETREECGIELGHIQKAGIISFEWQNNPEIVEMHVYVAADFLHEPRETEEMRPQWFHEKDIPFGEMWPDDILWMPLLLGGKKFKGKFLFDESDRVLSEELRETDEV